MSVSVFDDSKKTEVLVVLVNDTKKPLGKGLTGDLKACLKKPLEKDFKGKYRETHLLYTCGGTKVQRVLLVGTGPQKEIDGYKLRTLGATACQALEAKGLKKNVSVLVPNIARMTTADVIEHLETGTSIGQFSLTELKTDKESREKEKHIVFDFSVSEKKDVRSGERALERAEIIGSSVNWARRLIMLPPDHIYPESYVTEIKKMVASSPSKKKIKVTILTEKELTKLGYNGILGVSRGADRPPRMAVLEYTNAAKSKKPIALIGKGITFDSGGLSLKPPVNQETMKYDMAGSASVLGAFRAIVNLQVKTNLICITPMAENLPSGKAIKPGDVLKMGSGLSVEVLNTDAEGRLVLADAIYHATTKYKPKACVDVATLTGACAFLVGSAAAGLYTNDDSLANTLQKSAKRTQENLFPLPDYEDVYAKLLKSPVADLKNVGGREAGASTASIFLKRFVQNDVPWAHLDIAGCGWYDSPRDYVMAHGASGVPIRLLIDYVENNR